jgi:hypothetical protein
MSNPEDLRRYAEACIERAQSSDSSDDQLLFLNLAGAWRALAGQFEDIQTLSDPADAELAEVDADLVEGAEPVKVDA